MLMLYRIATHSLNQGWSIQFRQYQGIRTDVNMGYIAYLRQYHTKSTKSITGAVATISAEVILGMPKGVATIFLDMRDFEAEK